MTASRTMDTLGIEKPRNQILEFDVTIQLVLGKSYGEYL